MLAWPSQSISTHFGKSCIPDPFSTLFSHLEVLYKTILDLVDSGYPILFKAALLETHTQSDTKLCEPLLFYFYLISFVYEENVKNIMNCIVLVQTSPSSPLACFLDMIK